MKEISGVPGAPRMYVSDNTMRFNNGLIGLYFVNNYLYVTNGDGQYIATCFTPTTENAYGGVDEMIDSWIHEFEGLSEEETVQKLKKIFWNDIVEVSTGEQRSCDLDTKAVPIGKDSATYLFTE